MKLIEKHGVLGQELFLPLNGSAGQSSIISKDGQLYQRVQSDTFDGYEPLKVPDGAPTMAWVGEKIPLILWKQMLRFFAWSYNETKSETQVRFYYNRTTRLWKVWAFPQEANTGMSAREIAGPEFDQQFTQHIGPGFIPLVTGHHHCSAPAFQSGTDKHNEQDQDGLHVTIGDLGRDKYSLHSRVYYHKAECHVALSQWFNVPLPPVDPAIAPLLPDGWQSKFIEAALTVAPPKESWGDFPMEWRTNLIKVPTRFFGVGSGAGSHGVYDPRNGGGAARDHGHWGDDWYSRLQDDGGPIESHHYPQAKSDGKSNASGDNARPWVGSDVPREVVIKPYADRVSTAVRDIRELPQYYAMELDDMMVSINAVDAVVIDAIEIAFQQDVSFDDVVSQLITTNAHDTK